MDYLPIALAAALASIAIVSLRYQFRNLVRLRRATLPSDDRRYLRGQCQRRTLNSVLLLALAGMMVGSYWSGGMRELSRIANVKQQDPPAEITPEDRETIRMWAAYWIVFLIILFVVVAVAIADYSATTLYGRQQLRRLQGEHRERLERDLAVHRQQQLNDRMRRME